MNGIKKHTPIELMVCFFLVGIILAVYWQLPTHDFLLFDDNRYITHNTHVHEGITWENLVWAFTSTDFGYWHPLTWLSHMLAYQLFGLKFGMHHLTNLFLHIANTLLLFLVLKRMTGKFWQSVFVAAMFGIHPLNVESVAWVSERKNVLSTFFWMLTLLTYVRYVERPGFYRYFQTLFVFVLGLMAKPMLITLPFVLLLLDYWPLCRFNPAGSDKDDHPYIPSKITGLQRSDFLRPVIEKIPFIALSATCVYLSSLSIQRFGIAVSTASVPMKLRTANALVSYFSYIKKMVWPYDLAVFYPYPQTIPLWQVAGAGLLLLGLCFFVLRTARPKPYLSVGWLWYMGTLVPAMGLFQAGLWPAVADRFVYVPLIGLFMIVAWGVPEIFGKWQYKRVALIVAATAVLSAFTTGAWFQVRHWQNGVTLFTHNLNVTRNNSLAHFELGNALEEQGKFDMAVSQYVKALQITPHYAEAHNKLGYVLAAQKEYADAIYHYTEALRIKPNYAEAHNNLGTVLAHQGKLKDAVYHFNKALEINPEYAGAYYNLGKVFANHGKIIKAIRCYQTAVKLNPEMTQALYNLSWIIATHENETYRNGKKAVKLAERLCTITRYDQPLALDALAAAYAETGRFDAAVSTVQKALKLVVSTGPKELATGLKERLTLYQAGRPYRQTM